jgi:hypothetical protein
LSEEEYNPIPTDLDADQAKAAVLDTCKSPLEMDIAEMSRGLEKWGFKIKEFERLSEPNPRVLQEYIVWIDSHYGIELAKTNMANWLQNIPEFPWLGKWDFVVNYAKMNFAGNEFTVRVTRYTDPFYRLHGLNIKVPWPEYSRRELLKATTWQRPLIHVK